MDSVYTHWLSTGKHALNRINKGVSPLSTAFHMEKIRILGAVLNKVDVRNVRSRVIRMDLAVPALEG